MDLAGFGWIWLDLEDSMDLAGFGWIWLDLAGFGWIWLDLADLAGFGGFGERPKGASLFIVIIIIVNIRYYLMTINRLAPLGRSPDLIPKSITQRYHPNLSPKPITQKSTLSYEK